jgi:imidazolonepropionase-like amidohydrolase
MLGLTMRIAHCLVASLVCTLSVSAQQLSPTVAAYVKVKGPRTVLRHVRVIDGTGAPAVEDQDIYLADGKISKIVAASHDTPPAEAGESLDLTGSSVFPGIVGMHDHMYYIARPDLDAEGHAQPPLIVPEMAFSSPRLYLASGVTTLRTTGSVEPFVDLNLRREIDANHLPGPHMDVTAPYLEGANSPFIQMHNLTGPEDAKAQVDFWASQGATSFKAYMNITRAELKAAIDEVHAKGLKLTGHLCSVTYPEAAELGIDNLEHGFFVNTQLDPGKQPDVCPRTSGTPTMEAMDPEGPQAKALIALLVQHHVAITSTLPVFEQDGDGHPPLEQRVLDAMSPPAREAYLYTRNLQSTPHATQQPHTEKNSFLWTKLLAHPMVNQSRQIFLRDMQLERNFVAAGGLLLAGPDPTGDGHTLPGFGDQRELELLVEAGFSPVQAIRIGTLNGAIYLGRDRQIGSIAAGKNADLVVVHGDPSKRIADIENVELVFRDGLGFDSPKLLKSVEGRYGQY